MKQVTVDLYIIQQAKHGLRIAANILESRKRETGADRQIEYAERLMTWIIDGQKEETRPKWIP